MTAPHDLVAGRYRRERLVGSGGMGTVWEAWDELLDRRVALKQLRSPLGLTPEEAELANERAMREARITARLSHRYAVPVFDVVEHENRPCIVMPFIPAVTLSAVLREAGPLHPDEAAGVGAQIASALAAAHAVGIVHRDVKPGNILIADDGAAMISDFGISHALGDVTLTSAGEVHGTPAYLAPEAARGGQATTASDVFSLGSTLYAAVEGTPPFGTDQNSIALLHRVAAADFPPPQQAGPLAPLLAEMLASDPADRPPMGAVAGRLKALSGDAAMVTQSASPAAAGGTADEPTAPAPTDRDLVPPATGQPPRRRPARALAAVVALVIAGILAGVLWVQFGNPGGTAGRDPAGVESSNAPPAASGTPSDVDAPSTDTTPAPGPDGTGSAAPSASTTRPSTAAPSPTEAPRTTAPKRTRTRAPESPSADDLATEIRNYYALMPDDTDEGWSRLTASYQRGEARSRAYYESFWGQFSEVEVSNVSGEPPDQVEATLTYRFKSGRVDVERRVFRLVNEDGQFKISRSTVVSRGSGS